MYKRIFAHYQIKLKNEPTVCFTNLFAVHVVAENVCAGIIHVERCNMSFRSIKTIATPSLKKISVLQSLAKKMVKNLSLLLTLSKVPLHFHLLTKNKP